MTASSAEPALAGRDPGAPCPQGPPPPAGAGYPFPARLVFPLFVLALGAFASAVAARPAGPMLGLSADAVDGLGLVAAIVAGWGTVVALERLRPFRREWNRPHGDVGVDLAYVAASAGAHSLAQPVFRLVGVWLAAAMSGASGAGPWPTSWPMPAQLALALLVAEFGHYAFHRLSHEWEPVWRLHASHHSAPRLYWLNATRFHPLDLLALIACQVLPLLALGIGARALLAYTIFTSVYGQLQHGNIDLDAGPLRFVFSTPELHRWHHSDDPRKGNRNYGAVLITWDLVLGTFLDPRRRFDGRVGLAGLPGFPTDLLGQLASPWRWAGARRPARREGAGPAARRPQRFEASAGER